MLSIVEKRRQSNRLCVSYSLESCQLHGCAEASGCVQAKRHRFYLFLERLFPALWHSLARTLCSRNPSDGFYNGCRASHRAMTILWKNMKKFSQIYPLIVPFVWNQYPDLPETRFTALFDHPRCKYLPQIQFSMPAFS